MPLLSGRQIFEWMLYDEIEPFGSPADDNRAGTIAAVIANVNRDRKVRHEPFRPSDFFGPPAPPEPLSAEKIMAVLGAAAPSRKIRRVPR